MQKDNKSIKLFEFTMLKKCLGVETTFAYPFNQLE